MRDDVNRRINYILSMVIAVMVAVTAFASDDGPVGILTGRIMAGSDVPLSGGTVYIYSLATGPVPAHDRYRRVPDCSAVLDTAGRFSVELPAGDYAVAAVKQRERGDKGVPGGAAPNRPATSGEPLTGRDTSPAEQHQAGRQAGNVSFQSWRSGSGRMEISLPPQIASPQTIPPHYTVPREGDMTIFSLDEQGAAKRYSLPAGEKLDIGTVSGAQPFVTESQGAFTTIVEGTVVAENGKPIEGIQVYAFVSPDATGEALFVSSRSCELGRILLKMNQGGTYYLRAGKASVAESAAVAPVPYSTRKDAPTSVTVNTGGSVKGIMVNTHNKHAGRYHGN